MTRASTPLSRREEARVRLFADVVAKERRARARKMIVKPKTPGKKTSIHKTSVHMKTPATYTSESKTCMRALVHASHKTGGHLIYLDGPAAEATVYFVEHGVPKACLRPVNRNAEACAAIMAITGVPAIHTCIFRLMMRLRQKDTQRHTV